MSADSLRKQSKQGYHGQVILPQPINDPSLIESVAGFIHEVVPQAYSSVLPGDSKDGILWARFESTDYNDPENYPSVSECESESTPPLLLVLGYSSGVQVWSVGGSGEASELLSWCQGTLRALRFLSRPHSRDPHASKRPLVAIVDSSSPGPQFATLSFISLKNAEVVKIIKFSSPICDVHCNKKSIVVTFSEKIAVFDAATLEDRLTITTCYLSPGNSPNPVALGPRWLAYGEKRLTTWQRSSGGCEGDGAQSYTSTVIHAAKSLGKGLRELGGSLTGSSMQAPHSPQSQPGVVSIIDIERKCSNTEDEKGNMIAHFVAHTSAVVAMAFDPSGLLLVTADKHGHRFNVFRIHSHPCTAQLAAVHHLYVLHRGDTTARVQDITVSWDSRWVAVSSVRGTTHVFPITPYGGLVTVRTHTTSHVVSKLSRFERSAGLRDGRGSPLPCEAPSTPPPPRLPPYPHPSLVTPLAQLRARPEDAPLAAYFAPPRAWLPGRPKSKRTCADSLYVIYHSGAFMQYDLDPKVVQGIPKEKISFDTPIELGVEAKAEWILPKPPYTSSLCPPLPPGHVLLDLPPRPHQAPDKWLSQVEIVTHTGPHRRLWMGPQFLFKSIDPLPMSGGDGAEIGPESANPLKSNPVNMPHRPFLLVEVGSGSPQLAEIDELGGRLREDLADAMLETHHASGQAKGKLRRAEVEWQVNPLGAVQTHPAAHSLWPHPIFFEPYSPDHYHAVEQRPSPLKTVEDALQRLNLQEGGSEVQPRNPSSIDPTPPLDVKKLSLKDDVTDLSSHSSFPESPVVPSPLDIKATSHEATSDEGKLSAPEEATGPMPEEAQDAPCEGVESSSLNPDFGLKGDTSNSGLSSDDKCANKQVKEESEEKAKPPGKKNRKKKNGNDKKSRKILPKVQSEVALPPPSSKDDKMIDDVFPEFSENVITATSLVDINPDEVLEIEEEPNKIGSESFDILRTDQGADSSLSEVLTLESIHDDLKSVDHDAVFLSPRHSPPIIACGVIEVVEETLENLHPLLLDESYEIKVDPDSCLEPIHTFAMESMLDVTYEHSNLGSAPMLDISPEDSPALAMGKALLEGELELPPLTFDIPPAKSLLAELTEVSGEMPIDLNGNNAFLTESNVNTEEPTLPESLSSPDDTVLSTPEVLLEETVVHLVEPKPEEFTVVSSKSVRSRNRRKKKEKRVEDSNQPELNEELPEPIATQKSGDPPSTCALESVDIPDVTDIVNLSFKIPSVEEVLIDIGVENIDQALDEPDMEQLTLEVPLIDIKTSTDDSKSASLEASSSLLLSDDMQSDQVQSTDKSEVEDVSSHSGKESDDSKITKRERSRKQKRSESSDKDHSELKKKSPSPATAKSDSKDSESSDEAGQPAEIKLTSKAPKRKKGKKIEEGIPEVVDQASENLGSTIFKSSSPPKEKSSESSLESSSDSRPPRLVKARSFSHTTSSSDQQGAIEDRDSVYESCNDDGASDSLAFESSKEDFDDGSAKTSPTEPSSSTNEERTDSCDKTIQPLKKVRKQKKKKR